MGNTHDSCGTKVTGIANRIATGLVAAGLMASMAGCQISVRFGDDGGPQGKTPSNQGGTPETPEVTDAAGATRATGTAEANTDDTDTGNQPVVPIVVRAFVDDAATPEDLAAFKREAERWPETKAVTFTSKKRALEDYKADMGVESTKEAIDALGGQNPLPASFKLTPTNPDDAAELAEKVKQSEAFAKVADGLVDGRGDAEHNVSYGQDSIEHIVDWTDYRSLDEAAADIGFPLDVPPSAYGRAATDFLVCSDYDGNRFLRCEYWDDDATAIEEFGVVAKMRGFMPPAPSYDTAENRHQVNMGETAVTLFGNGEETVARWETTDTDGEVWGYYARIGQGLSDPEMLAFVSAVR